MYNTLEELRGQKDDLYQGMSFMYAVLKVQPLDMAQWLSWLERRPVTAEVESSSLFWVASDQS